MTNADQMYKQLRGLSDQQERLRELFFKFSEVAETLVRFSDSPIKGASVVPHLDLNFFELNYGGKVFQYCFSYALNAEGRPIGEVSCFVVNQDKAGRDLVFKFSFKNSGAVDSEGLEGIKDPDCPEAPVVIGEQRAVNYLVCYGLHTCFTRAELKQGAIQ